MYFFSSHLMTTAILVDDNLDMVEKLADMLGEFGIQVLDIATNGKDAVELYQKHYPEVVLTDMQMPQYDGLYALENIRKIDPDAKVIMVTADLREESENAFLENNASAIVYKPYDLKQIMDTINQVVNGTLEMC